MNSKKCFVQGVELKVGDIVRAVEGQPRLAKSNLFAIESLPGFHGDWFYCREVGRDDGVSFSIGSVELVDLHGKYNQASIQCGFPETLARGH